MSSTSSNVVPPEPPRLSIRLPHWGWFLLATVVVVVASLGLSLWLPYHREQHIVEKISSWGGRAYTVAGGPIWLRRILGDNCMKVFDRVDNVILQETGVTDADVAHLAVLTSLVQLDLNGTQVGDAGLAYLKRLTNLGYLHLNRTRISDAGLVHLSGLPNLKEL